MENTTDAQKPATGIYKMVLGGSIAVFALSAFATVLMILFTNFNDSTQANLFGRVLFITWQTIWFGLLSVFFANRFDKNPLPLAKAVSLFGLIIAAGSLLIGIGQALEFFDALSLVSLGVKLATIFAVFLYSAIFAEFMLLIARPIPSVVLARNITVGTIGIFDLIAVMLVAMDYAPTGEMMWRLLAVFIIVAVVGLIITCILNSMHKDQLKQYETPSQQIAGNNNHYPNFVAVTPATPLELEKHKHSHKDSDHDTDKSSSEEKEG